MNVVSVIDILQEIMAEYHQYGVEYFYVEQYSDSMRQYDEDYNVKYDVETDFYKIDFKTHTVYLM